MDKICFSFRGEETQVKLGDSLVLNTNFFSHGALRDVPYVISAIEIGEPHHKFGILTVRGMIYIDTQWIDRFESLTCYDKPDSKPILEI